MPDMPRILAITSSDFGEMAGALYLLDGVPAHVQFLLPPRLHEKNASTFPSAAAQYSSLEDILRALVTCQPNLLLLHSAYLLGINRLLDTSSLAHLLAQARQLNITVATTDPFLGQLATLSDSTFTHPQKAALAKHFAEVFTLLKTIPHVYNAPLPPSLATPAAAFYNPRVVISPMDRQALQSTLTAANLGTHWLFILSLEDYIAQCSIRTQPVFNAILSRLLTDTLQANRHPILLAPEPARASLSAPPGATVLGFCNHSLFQALSLTGEHVFYWNIFSHSILSRVSNGGSVFFFDLGHMARSMPTLVPIAMRSYYADATLPMLDASVPLNPDTLRQAATAQRATFAPALANFQKLPSAAAMIATLLQREPS
jgi:hypothetical protein